MGKKLLYWGLETKVMHLVFTWQRMAMKFCYLSIQILPRVSVSGKKVKS
jgi:hypothetical protein